MKTKTKALCLLAALAAGSAVAVAIESRHDHDPFDVYRVDPGARRLHPLIYSAGRDGISGIREDPDYVTHRGTDDPGKLVYPSDWPRIDPSGSPLGTQGEGSTDNIHNHLIKYGR